MVENIDNFIKYFKKHLLYTRKNKNLSDNILKPYWEIFHSSNYSLLLQILSGLNLIEGILNNDINKTRKVSEIMYMQLIMCKLEVFRKLYFIYHQKNKENLQSLYLNSNINETLAIISIFLDIAMIHCNLTIDKLKMLENIILFILFALNIIMYICDLTFFNISEINIIIKIETLTVIMIPPTEK